MLRPGITLVLFVVFAVVPLPSRAQGAGEIYWFSLLSENVYTAMDFYSGLFGWEIATSPRGGFMALRNGEPFAGLNQIEDRVPNASESLWLAAITVVDVEQSVATARMLGATIHEDVTDLPGWGMYALIQDLQGAPALLVKPARPLGGTLGYSGWRWAELWTHDTGAAAEFYSQVIGYELEEIPVGEHTYTAFRSSGKRNAGLVELDRPEIAARWAPYVGVADLRGILVRVWQEGGKVLREPSEVDFEAAGANRVALIADPTGAALFLYQLEEQAIAEPAVSSQASRTFGEDPRTQSGGGGNVHVSVTVGYGFGPGWGGVYPAYPFGRFGPYY
jgi:predicted enzyme related to lactoylglutathione lyase